MKRFLWVLVLFWTTFALAQGGGQGTVGNFGLQYVLTAPTGSCSANAPQTDVVGVGIIYTCQNGTWAKASSSGGGGIPGGSDTQVQFNDGGAFGGASNLLWNKSTNTFALPGSFTMSGSGNSASWLYPAAGSVAIGDANGLGGQVTLLGSGTVGPKFDILVQDATSLKGGEVGVFGEPVTFSGVPITLANGGILLTEIITNTHGLAIDGSTGQVYADSLDLTLTTNANGFKIPVQAGATTTTSGALAVDSTNNNLQAGIASATSIVPTTTITPVNGNCSTWSVAAGRIKLGDTGSPCGGSPGGGIIGYSASALTITANTYYFPIVGGGLPSTTETTVDTEAPSAATVANFYASISTALGGGNTAVFTYRNNAADQSMTCTITGASQTSCNDSTHSFAVAKGDLMTIKVVTTGTIVVTPTLVMTAQFGTTGSNGTVNNSGTANAVAKYPATGTAVSPGSMTDDGTHGVASPNGIGLVTGGGISFNKVNDASTGTTANKFTCKSATAGRVVICPTSTVTGVLGVAVAGLNTAPGTTGSTSVCFSGICSVITDNTTVIGDYGIPSTTVAGDIHDTGSTTPTAGTDSFLITSVATAGNAAQIELLTPDWFAAQATAKVYQLKVNGGAVLTAGDIVNFNGTTPTAGSNGKNITVQTSKSGNTDSVSMELVGNGTATTYLDGTGNYSTPAGGGAATETVNIPFDQCTPGQATNAGNSFYTTVAFTNWDAGMWSFVLNTAADIWCSIKVPHNVDATPAAKVITDFSANDATSGHTDVFNIADVISSSKNPNVGSFTNSSTCTFTTTTTAYATTECTFTVNATVVADQLLVVKIHQAASNSVTANVVMPPPMLQLVEDF